LGDWIRVSDPLVRIFPKGTAFFGSMKEENSAVKADGSEETGGQQIQETGL